WNGAHDLFLGLPEPPEGSTESRTISHAACVSRRRAEFAQRLNGDRRARVRSLSSYAHPRPNPDTPAALFSDSGLLAASCAVLFRAFFFPATLALLIITVSPPAPDPCPPRDDRLRAFSPRGRHEPE